MSDAATSAGLEAEYLKCKKNGFPHPPEVEEQLDIMRGIREEVPKLRDRVAKLDDLYKSLAEAEDKYGASFNHMREKPMMHHQMGNIYKIYGDAKTQVAAKRFQMQALFHEIREEWKDMEVDLENIREKQDLANRNISDMTYFNKKGLYAQGKEKEQQYKMSSTELISLIHDLRMKKEKFIPQYLMRLASAEAEFYAFAAQIAQEVQRQLQNIGPVQPVLFEGVPGYDVTTSFDSEAPSLPPQVPQHIPQSNALPMARAMYDFNAQEPTELSFRAGDVLEIHSQQGDWWQAKLNGKLGLVPSNYIQMI